MFHIQLNRDTFSAQESKSLQIPPAFVRVLAPVLFSHMRTIMDISAAIKAQRYRSLVDYMVDIMDVMHCIGVLRGTKCAEYEAAKYLQIDALLDIVEMSRCQDCFRQSNDRSDPKWFLRPCTVPHKLVFAKLNGFSYWPAKVIRHMRSADAATQFDVRFFGKDHMRALVDEKSIVLDGRPIRLKMSYGLKKALAELAEHKVLLEQQLAADGDAVDAAVTQELTPIKASAKVAATPLPPSSEVKRGRGRPKKSSTPVLPEIAAATTSNRGPVKRRSANAIPAPISLRNGRRSTMTATAAASDAIATTTDDGEEEDASVLSSSSVKRGRRSTMTAAALTPIKSGVKKASERKDVTTFVATAPAAKRARRSTNEPLVQVAASAAATESIVLRAVAAKPRGSIDATEQGQNQESDSNAEAESTDDDDTEDDGNYPAMDVVDDDVVDNIASHAKGQQQTSAWIISNVSLPTNN